MKLVLRALALVLLSAVVGMALLVGVYALPKDGMRSNVIESAKIFAYESGYPRLIEGWHISMLDNYTDSMMLLTAIGEDREGKGLLALAADAPHAMYTGGSWLVNYIDAYAADNLPVDSPQMLYPRYWHGYLLTLKPALMLFDYAQLRLVNMIAQSFLLFYALLLLVRKTGARFGVALLAAVLCLVPVVLPLSLQFSTVFYLALLALIIVLKADDWLMASGRYALFFCLLGIVTNYMDLLTYPLLTLCVPLSVLLLLRRDATVRESLTVTALSCAFYGAGYALMWASKWGIATLITGTNVFADAMTSAAERTSLMGIGELGAGEITRFGTIRALVALLWRRPYLLMAAGIALGVVVLILKKRDAVGLTPLSKHAPSWLLIAALPLIWYAVLPNHSYQHYFYTFRTLAATVFALLCCGFAFLKDGKAAPDARRT